MNREIEKRPKWEPKLADLRDSGFIEQDADLVLFLVWMCKFTDKCDADDFRVYCAKRRNGPIRHTVVHVSFNPDRQQFGAKEHAEFSQFAGAREEGF